MTQTSLLPRPCHICGQVTNNPTAVCDNCAHHEPTPCKGGGYGECSGVWFQSDGVLYHAVNGSVLAASCKIVRCIPF